MCIKAGTENAAAFSYLCISWIDSSICNRTNRQRIDADQRGNLNSEHREHQWYPQGDLYDFRGLGLKV